MQQLLRCFCVTYIVFSRWFQAEHCITPKDTNSLADAFCGKDNDKLSWTLYHLKKAWSSVCVLEGGCRVKALRCWAAPAIWQWHYTYAPFDIADGRHMCSTRCQITFDPNWGERRMMLRSKTRGRSLPCSRHSQLISNCPAWRHSVHWIAACSDKVTKLTKAGIKNPKPFLIHDQQD